MSALLENGRDRLLKKMRENPELDPFKDLVTGTDESPDEILGYNPAIYAAELAKLNAICDKYRQTNAPKGGIVVVQGERGSGKTTLLHRLRRERPRDLILRPTHYRSDRPFPQYLLQEMVSELDRRAQKDENSPIDFVANQLAAEVVYQKLASLTEPEWLREYAQWQECQDWIYRQLRDWRMHWGLWTNQDVAVREKLLHELHSVQGAWDLVSLSRSQATRLPDLQKLAENHIRDSESKVDLQGVIRAGLYKRLVRLAFARFGDKRKDAKRRLFDFLFDGYLKEYRGVSAPDLAGETVLRSLLGLFLGQNIATLITFDAVETPRMLGDPPDHERSRHFYGGLADFRDNYPGIAFLLFTEVGYWSNTRMLRYGYAEDRINEGIPDVDGHGTISTIYLGGTNQEYIQAVVRDRLAPLHRTLRTTMPDCEEAIDSLFPLNETMIAQNFPPNNSSLRQGLLGLRGDYLACLSEEKPRAIKEDAKSKEEPSTTSTTQLDDKWSKLYADFSETTESNMSGLADTLLSILNDWLRIVKPSVGEWSFQGAEMKSFGPTTYEQFILCKWKKGKSVQTIALGFLLGYRMGLANDLRKKLANLSQNKKEIQTAVLLYPTASFTDCSPPYHNHLPVGTRRAWEEAAPKKTVQLQPIPLTAILEWLTVGSFIEHLCNSSTDKTSETAREFAIQKTQHLLNFVGPSFQA